MMQKLLTKVKSIFSSNIVRGSLFLCVSAFICKIIGVVYRIPLTNIIGAEGVGLYQLVFPIYSFLLVISSNGIPVALSKLIAQKRQELNFAYLNKLKKISFLFFGALGLIMTGLLMVFAEKISAWQGNSNAYLGYLFIAPSVLIVSFICVFRGLFQGLKSMRPTGVSQIIEQSIKFVFGLILPVLFVANGIYFQVGMATLAVTISELIALSYLFVKSKTNNQYKDIFCVCSGRLVKTKDVFVDILKNVLPITLSNCIIPISVLIESFFIVNILQQSTNLVTATEVYGVYSGVVAVLINAPIVLASSTGIALVPNIAEKNCTQAEVDKQNEDNKIFKEAIFLCLLISVPSSLFFALFSNFTIEVLYPALSDDLIILSSQMLACSAINVITLSLSYILIYYLQTCISLYKPVVCLLIMNALRLVLGVISLTKWGVLAYVVFGAFVYLMQLLQLLQIKHMNKCRK